MSAGERKPAIPDWALSTCDDCGGHLWDGHVWSNLTDKRTHLDCERAARRDRDLPVEYALLRQGALEVVEQLGRFVCGAEDAEWGDPEALQRAIVGAYSGLGEALEGMRRYGAREDAT